MVDVWTYIMAVLFTTAEKPKTHVFGRYLKTFAFEAIEAYFYIYFFDFCVKCFFCFSFVTCHYLLLEINSFSIVFLKMTL